VSRRELVLVACLLAGSLGAPALLARPAWSSEGRESSSREVSLEEVPDPARQALLGHAGPHRIRELEEKVVDGKTVYEIELLVDGKETEVVVAPDGELVQVKRDDVVALGRADDAEWRRSFDVDKKNLGPVGSNPFFPLTPGLKIHLSDGSETVVFSVLDETKVVDGVETRVVEERETEDGELVEISRNYFAADRTTGDVYYFGEDVDIYEDGKVVSHDGGWLSGVNGVNFGLIMPGKPAVGDKFYLETAPGAVERVEIAALDAKLDTPLRGFTALVYCREHDVLDGGQSQKWYARGVGMVGDDEMRAVKIEEPPAR
jgi:hypothetical protein